MKKRRFQAKIIDATGAQRLTLAATSYEEAYQFVSNLGSVVYCKEELRVLPQRALDSQEREQFLMQLSFLLGSGVGTGQALRVMQQTYTGRMSEVAAELLAQVEEGVGLDEALRITSERDFSPALLALVRAGYQSGKGHQALASASRFEAELRALKETSGLGLVSALIGFLFAAGATLASVFYIGPEIVASPIVSSVDSAVNVGWAMTLGYVISAIMLAMLLGIGMLFFVHHVVRKVDGVRADRFTQAIPLWRDIALAREAYLTYFSVSSLVGASLGLETAFETAAQGAARGKLFEEMRQASQSVRVGAPWMDALSSLGPIDKAALKGATDRIQLGSIFENLAIQHKTRYAKSRHTASVMLQGIAALCLTASGVILFALSTLPLLQASSAIF